MADNEDFDFEKELDSYIEEEEKSKLDKQVILVIKYSLLRWLKSGIALINAVQ